MNAKTAGLGKEKLLCLCAWTLLGASVVHHLGRMPKPLSHSPTALTAAPLPGPLHVLAGDKLPANYPFRDGRNPFAPPKPPRRELEQIRRQPVHLDGDPEQQFSQRETRGTIAQDEVSYVGTLHVRSKHAGLVKLNGQPLWVVPGAQVGQSDLKVQSVGKRTIVLQGGQRSVALPANP